MIDEHEMTVSHEEGTKEDMEKKEENDREYPDYDNDESTPDEEEPENSNEEDATDADDEEEEGSITLKMKA